MTDTADIKIQWIAHLYELRKRLILSISLLLVVFFSVSIFANPLYTIFAGPLLHNLPPHGQMIAIGVATPFLAPLKLSFVLSIFMVIPWLLYQAWAFVAPGLYARERIWIWPLIMASTLLFYLGAFFAYLIILPLLFRFFIHAAPSGVTVMTDINEYLDFVFSTLLAFGVAFEVPVVVCLLVRSGICTVENLKSLRPYIIVSAFILGMLLTPPDVLSQVTLALPLWGLFEAGLLCAKWIAPKNSESKNQ